MPVCQIQVLFYLLTYPQQNRTVCGASPEIRQLVWTIVYSAAIIEKHQSHHQANKAKSAGEISAVSIQTLLSCSMTEDFIDYSVKLRVAISKRMTEKTSIRCVFFIFFNGWKTGCGFCKFLCSDTLLSFIGPSLKVGLMVHLCFVLLQWKLHNKEGQSNKWVIFMSTTCH